MKRIPNNALQKALIALLKEKQSTPVYDFVNENAKLPYISLGAFTARDISTKTEEVTRISLQINIFSSYRGKYEVNAIAEKVIKILTTNHVDLDSEDFYITLQAVNMYEAFPEDMDSYSGVISFECEIENMRREE